MKQCPYCAEDIKDEAVVCRYCGSSLSRGREIFRLLMWVGAGLTLAFLVYGLFFSPLSG